MCTRDVWFDVIVRVETPLRMRANAHHFAPCARTAPGHLMNHIAMWEAPTAGDETVWGDHVTDAENASNDQQEQPDA